MLLFVKSPTVDATTEISAECVSVTWVDILSYVIEGQHSCNEHISTYIMARNQDI